MMIILIYALLWKKKADRTFQVEYEGIQLAWTTQEKRGQRQKQQGGNK